MKIGIFLPNATFDLPGSPEVGGIETFSFTIGEALQRLGHDVVLFGGEPKPGRTHRATTVTLALAPYWETRSIPDLGTRFQRLVQRLHFAWSSRAHWQRHACDLVLLAKPFDWPVAWWWKRTRPGLKAIMGFQGTDFFAGDRRFYGAVDAAFAVSPRVADLAEARVGRRPVLIPNPTDVDFFCPASNTPPSSRPWHLVASGRLVGWKGFVTLLDAFARLRREEKIDARLTLAGAGPERDNLTNQARALGVEADVTFAGLLDAVPLRDLLRSGDLYILPSLGLDACPVSTLEAASVGLPLALSDQVGSAAFFTAADCATYPARDGDALVSLLKRLHGQRHDLAWTDRTARHLRQREQFSPERIAARILDLVR